MKKAEELKLYAPEPKRPELDAALCMSVAEGQGMGRYIEGKVLTVAVWDKKEKPLVVWRFFGDYWTGELRGNENPTKGELSPRQIEVKPCQCLTWRTEVPATKGESEANLLARDQIGTLSADLTRTRQESAGVKEYIWRSSGDERVRACHRELDGKTFRYDDPPAMWYMTKRGKIYTGRHCNPGEDYQCRCVAKPVFDFNRLNSQAFKEKKQ